MAGAIAGRSSRRGTRALPSVPRCTRPSPRTSIEKSTFIEKSTSIENKNPHKEQNMGWQLPPLNALRAFEAAGRLSSFTLAAEELHVTPGAVSRQIKLLEATLGIPLFIRNNREVRLTPATAPYLNSLTESFRRMDAATGSLRDARRD